MNAVEVGPSQTIGRYEVYSEIASGGMASVCFGRQVGHVGFARTVAIKRLHPHVAREPDFVQMFLDEARLATRIHNAHVVQTLDVVAAGGELLLVMEYVHGEALSKLLTTTAKRGERVEPRIAIAIAAGILEGLHAAHEARSERGQPLEIVHRDVSPQNVLVGIDGVARVFDFGIAKAADRLHTTQDGSLKGKLAYMSPEQLENSKVDRRTDVWAASVVLWEMLAGKRLFVADSQAALVRVVLKKDIPLLTSFGLSPQVDRVVQQGLERDPERRFSTTREMALALEEALAPAPPRAVGGWVERNATNELRDRSRILEQVGGDAAARRPSGATKVEVAALLSSEETPIIELGSDDDTTLNAKGKEGTSALPASDTTTPLSEETQPRDGSDGTFVPLAETRIEQLYGGATPQQPVPAFLPSALPAHQTFPPPAPTSPDLRHRMRSGQTAMTIGIACAGAAVVLIMMLVVMLGRRSPPAASEDPPIPVPMPPITSTVATSTGTTLVAPAPPPPPPPPPPTTATLEPTPPTPASTPIPPSPTPTPVTHSTPTGRPHPHPPPPKPPPTTAPKKCTPFDFDYPACLKK